jgi:hypothetical protein
MNTRFCQMSNTKCHFHVSLVCPSKLMWLLKSLLNQNLIMSYHKSNDDFKGTLVLKKHKEYKEDL